MAIERATRWYVAQTHVNAEAKAADDLARQGFSVYLPRYLKRRSHAEKVDRVVRARFFRVISSSRSTSPRKDGALFSQRWVFRTLSAESGKPASVEDSVINALKAREDEGGFIMLARRAVFSPGDKVRVVEGAFVDSLALVEGVSDHERVAVLLDLLGRKVRVLVGADLIAAA